MLPLSHDEVVHEQALAARQDARHAASSSSPASARSSPTRSASRARSCSSWAPSWRPMASGTTTASCPGSEAEGDPSRGRATHGFLDRPGGPVSRVTVAVGRRSGPGGLRLDRRRGRRPMPRSSAWLRRGAQPGGPEDDDRRGAERRGDRAARLPAGPSRRRARGTSSSTPTRALRRNRTWAMAAACVAEPQPWGGHPASARDHGPAARHPLPAARRRPRERRRPGRPSRTTLRPPISTVTAVPAPERPRRRCAGSSASRFEDRPTPAARRQGASGASASVGRVEGQQERCIRPAAGVHRR